MYYLHIWHAVLLETFPTFLFQVILRLQTSRDGTEWDVFELKRLFDHQDNILSLVSVSGKTVARFKVIVLMSSQAQLN